MAPRSHARARRAAGRLAVLALAASAAAVCRFGSSGPAYAVKGAWQGEPTALKSAAKGDLGAVMEGLEPVFAFPSVGYSREGVALSVEDGHLNAAYSTKLDDDILLNFNVNDEKAWVASLGGHNASLRIRGEGADLDTLAWEAAQASKVEDVGDVLVEFNSDKEYNLTVTRESLARLAGAELDARMRATNAGVTGRLGARRRLPRGAEVTYSVENPVGVYDLGNSTHIGRLSAPVAGGEAALRVEGDASQQTYEGSYARDVAGGRADLRVSHRDGALGYNVSYARSFGEALPVDAAAHAGVDEDGAYARLTAGRAVGKGLDARYEALARLGFGAEADRQMKQALRLSNKLGYAELSHRNGDGAKLRMGYEFNA